MRPYHDRLRALNSIEELVRTIRPRDARLAETARGRSSTPRIDVPDGYPRGGDGGGRAGGTSDPTGSAVEQRESQAARMAQLAEDAYDAVFDALAQLKRAESLSARALEPPRMAEPEKRAPEAIWCISCARAFPKELTKDFPGHTAGEAISFEPRSSATKRSRDDLCNWCLAEWEGSNEVGLRRKLPDTRLVIWRADHSGRYVTERVRADVLAPQKSSQVA